MRSVTCFLALASLAVTGLLPCKGDTVGPNQTTLVAWWGLDEGSGTTASDASGHNHSGTLQGGATWTSGGIRLNGGNQIVTFEDTPFRLAEGTWEVTVNVSQRVSGMIMMKEANGANNDAGLWIDEAGLPHFYIDDSVYAGAYSLIQGTSAIPLNQDVVLTAEWGSKGMLLFVNGLLVADAPSTAPVTSIGSPLTLGTRTDLIAPFANSLTGVIKDAKVYSGYVKVITDVPRMPLAPAAFSLEQNYPNPFNPSTSIRFELSRATPVRLEVVDLLGQTVAVLVSERSEAGVHEVRFDASRLASGVYLCRLRAGDFAQTRKMLFLR